jgi:hypothetical protein
MMTTLRPGEQITTGKIGNDSEAAAAKRRENSKIENVKHCGLSMITRQCTHSMVWPSG